MALATIPKTEKSHFMRNSTTNIYVLFGVSDHDTHEVERRLDEMQGTSFVQLPSGSYFIASPLDSSRLAHELLSPRAEDQDLLAGMVSRLYDSYGAFPSNVRNWMKDKSLEAPNDHAEALGRNWAPSDCLTHHSI